MHLAGKIVAGIVIFMVVAAVVLLLSAESLLNGVFKERLLREVQSRKGTSLSLGPFHYHILANRISCESLRFSFKGKNADSLVLAADAFSWSDVNWLKAALGNGLSCGSLTVDGLRGEVFSRAVEDSLPTQGREEKQDRVDDSQFPVPLSIGQLIVRGGGLYRTMYPGSGGVRDSVSRFALTVTDFRLGSLSAGSLGAALAEGHIKCEVEQAAFHLPGSPYRITCTSAQVTDDVSTVQIDSLRIVPSMSDKDFFSGSRAGSTRFRALIGRLTVRGLDVAGLIDGERYAARLISLSQPVINITVDKRGAAGKLNPSRMDSAKMPNEILTGIEETVLLDSLRASGGIVEYAELYPWSSTPAVLRWSAVHLAIAGISNESAGTDSSSARIQASGMFQDAARMTVSMVLPLARREFSLSCHGVVDSLPLPSLNSFLVVAERIRVLSGRADSIKFSLSAADNRSSGRVRPLYRDLKIELLEKQSGRSDGIMQKAGTFMANAFKIRKDNLPDGPDGIKEGPVHYRRLPDDPFFKFVWFSLRGGLGNVVGF